MLLLLAPMMGVALKINAQEVSPKATVTTITPQKRLLIKELLTVTESDKNSDRIFNLMLLQIETDLPQIMSNAIDKNPAFSKLSQSEQSDLKKRINASAQRFSKRYRELLSKRINFAAIVENISYPLYNNYFTETELKDLIAFYQSSTGKKSISVMPQLFAESMQRSNQLLLPKVLEVIKEIMAEEFPSLKPKN
jgi:hypothetical protein